MQSRFWWRALDAHAPEEPRPAVVPRAAPAAYTAPPLAAPLMGGKPLAPKREPFRLEIPKSDRRHARRRRVRAVSARSALAMSALLLTCAAAIAVFVSGAAEPRRIQVLLSTQLQEALLGFGFGIDQVSLAGHQFTSDNDIYDALDLRQSRTFASFDASAALKRLEDLPWVEHAQITRLFPGGVRVDIRERRPVALWVLKGRTYLIDATGRVLGAAGEPQNWQLRRVAGEGANLEANLLFTALGRQPAIEAAVERADRIGGRRWSLLLKNGSRLELGADREIEGLEQIATNSELRRVLSGPAMVADVRTAGRVTARLASAGNGAERRP